MREGGGMEGIRERIMEGIGEGIGEGIREDIGEGIREGIGEGIREGIIWPTHFIRWGISVGGVPNKRETAKQKRMLHTKSADNAQRSRVWWRGKSQRAASERSRN